MFAPLFSSIDPGARAADHPGFPLWSLSAFIKICLFFGLFHGRAGPVKFFADESDDEGYAEMVMNSLKK